MIYTQKKILNASLCGIDAKLSCLGAFCMVEDALTEMMGELEIDGLTTRRKYNATWVFTKNHMKFFAPVDWKEPITIESYVTEKNKVFLYIDTCIKNSKDEIAVYSRVELCGIDNERGRICRAATIGIDDHVICEPVQFGIAFFEKDTVPTSPIDSVVVKASNLDYVHHTNNVEYMRFLINTFSSGQLMEKPIKEMEISYLNQSFEGDRLDISKADLPDRAVFSITKGDTRVIGCDMRF